MRKHVVFLMLGAGLLFPLPAAGGGVAGASLEEFTVPETGCALSIDLDVLLMTVYLDGSIYKTYPVSGGTGTTPSPVGVWHVKQISDWGEGFGGSWIGLDVPWGVYGIHGTRQPWLVGRQLASHGCIRMRDRDAREVKNLVSVGTPVRIKQDSLPFRKMGKGMTGSDVYRAQLMLKDLGFYTGPVDGIFGEGMERAVKGFQRAFELGDNGLIGRRTYEKLLEQHRLQDYSLSRLTQ